jgi:hypothetical protein
MYVKIYFNNVGFFGNLTLRGGSVIYGEGIKTCITLIWINIDMNFRYECLRAKWEHIIVSKIVLFTLIIALYLVYPRESNCWWYVHHIMLCLVDIESNRFCYEQPNLFWLVYNKSNGYYYGCIIVYYLVNHYESNCWCYLHLIMLHLVYNESDCWYYESSNLCHVQISISHMVYNIWNCWCSFHFIIL